MPWHRRTVTDDTIVGNRHHNYNGQRLARHIGVFMCRLSHLPLYSDGGCDMRMGLVFLQRNILKFEIKDARDAGRQRQLWQRQRGPLQLRPRLL